MDEIKFDERNCYNCSQADVIRKDDDEVYCLDYPKQNDRKIRYKGSCPNWAVCKKDPKVIEKAKKKETKVQQALGNFTNFMQIAEHFIQEQPIFYDKNKLFWLWNHKENKWEIIDEVDLMNSIDEVWANSGLSIKSNIKNEIIEALKRKGRKNIPKDAPKTWLQFKDKIYDLQSGKIFEASSDYFITNPIPWKVGDSEDTPNMDRIFKEWIIKEGVQDESYVKTLYELISYCILPSMPIHRIFCLVGDGLNGKGTFLRLVEKFIGEENVTSSNLDTLTKNNFESAKLYRKLVVLVGEVDKGVFTKTATIKGITGDDLIRVEYKGKNSFDAHMYATPITACNTLPETTDKTKGFFRRWTIIDFPNEFNEKKNILDEIPKAEYENLCKKSLRVLKELLVAGEFTNDGSIKDREIKYESHSNPIINFVKEFCIRDRSQEMSFDDFYEDYSDYLKSQNFRHQSKKEIGISIKVLGFNKRRTTTNDGYGNNKTTTFIEGIRWKE